MILPSKHLSQNRALMGIGAEIISELREPQAVSELWEHVRVARKKNAADVPLSYDWFVLSLTFLHAIFAIELKDGVIARTGKQR